MRVRREIVVCALALTWSQRAAASEEDAVVDRASNDMKCSELQLVHESHKYWVAGCGQRRTYDCSSGTCATIASADTRPAAKGGTKASAQDDDSACVAKNILVGTAYVGCACVALLGKSGPPPPPTPDTCR